MKTYKYRLYPNKQQKIILTDTLESCRQLYNCALEQRTIAYKEFHVSLHKFGQQTELPEIKKYFPEFKRIHSQVLTEVIVRVDRSFRNFFRRIKIGEKPGYPRFKGSGRYNSFIYTQSGFSLSANHKGNQRLKLSKIGEVKIRLHRAIQGDIKTCTIKRELNNWYVCFSCEVKPEILPKTYKDAGVDVGLEKFKAHSDGQLTPNPRFLRKSEAKLKYEQRVLSRKKNGSNSREKQKYKIAKLHYKIKNQRNDFLHKKSRTLVNDYDTIVFEDLPILNMVKNHHLAKSITDASWGRFMDFTAYKAANAGKLVLYINPRGTSIDCSGCGAPVKKSLSVRTHKCPYCGLILDRDVNAAINILRLGTNPG